MNKKHFNKVFLNDIINKLKFVNYSLRNIILKEKAYIK
jgi:hypothetical protein